MITDRGPARELVLDGRLIDLAQAAVGKLGDCSLGLLPVAVRPEPSQHSAKRITENPFEAGVEQPGASRKVQNRQPAANEIRLPVSLPKTAS
jgi:rare lipoprotein A (peptidoglycan hydrolase)